MTVMLSKRLLPADVTCGDPVERHLPMGRRLWPDGSRDYTTSIVYDCGPNAVFEISADPLETEEQLESTCQWDTLWSWTTLPPCQCK